MQQTRNTYIDQWQGREEEINRLHKAGHGQNEIAKLTGIPRTTIQIYAAGFEYSEVDDMRGVYKPSPQQIARECESIRARWNRDEERQRRAIKEVAWEVPNV